MVSRLIRLSLLLLAAFPAVPVTARADAPKDIPVVVPRVECVRWRCGAGFQDALTDRVSSALTRGRRYKPVDRANLTKALGEQLKCRKGIRKGIISRDCLIEAGRAAQARKMITGRLVSMGDKDYQLTLGLTDLLTVKNERSESLLCRRCERFALLKLVDRAVAKLAGKPLKASGGRGGKAPAPPPPVPRATPEPEQELPPVAPELGRLRVEGTPRGARVDVSGPKGFKGPRAAALPRTWNGVPAGTYRVTMRAKDHEPHQTRVQVLPDRTKVVAVDLVKAIGSLTVGGKPGGARVVVTGASGYRKVWGLTRSFTLRRVRRGNYTVTVSRTGYTRFARQVQVVGGKDTRVSVNLEQVATTSTENGPRLAGTWRFRHDGKLWTEMRFQRHSGGGYTGTVVKYLENQSWTRFKIKSIQRQGSRVTIVTRFIDEADSKITMTLSFKRGGRRLSGTIRGSSYGTGSMSIEATRLD